MRNQSYEHVLSFALSHPWNMERSMLQVVAGILARRIAGVETDQATVEAALVNRKNLPQPRAGSAAVIPVYGALAPRMNMMSEMSGGMSYDKISGNLRAAVADKTVKTVVMDFDTPGGSVAGNAELAAEIMRARTKKPIIAQVQFTCASAGYQLAAACTEIISAPSGRVGSIGTYAIHDDISEALKQLGVNRTFISAGEGKDINNQAAALNESGAGRIQAMVNDGYGQFVGNVVKGRGQGVTSDKVRNEWKAHLYTASEALSLGMIDGIATLDETLTRVLSGSPDPEDQRAALSLSRGDDTPQEPQATGQDHALQVAREQQVLAFRKQLLS